MPLFSIRSVIELAPRPQGKAEHLYEERITLWRAADANEAIARAEREARVYAKGERGPLPLFQAFALYDDVTFSGESVEVFSLIRESDLLPAQYLDSFFDTGGEKSQHE
jgi:hypothetical protein